MDDLLRALPSVLDDESAAVVRQLVPWTPAVERVLRSATDHECSVAYGFRGHSACCEEGIAQPLPIALRLRASRALLDFHERPPGPNFSEAEPYVPPAFVEVPTVLALHAGSAFAVVELRAWLSDVSRLFEGCRDVRDALVRGAMRGDVLMLLFDDESDRCFRVYPADTLPAYVPSPDGGRFDIPDSLFIDVDSWCGAVLR